MTMAKRNKKSQTATAEPVSVRDRCDYQRANGKCGRAMCGNCGKPCPGRTCGDWSCGAEGDATAAETDAVAVYGDSVPSGPASYRDRVSRQYAAIETAKDNLLRECVKFGALLTEAGHYLGEARHANNEGEGLKRWLAENCPEVNYNTAMGYKALAAKCVKMLGGGSQAVAVLQDKTEVVPPGGEAPVAVEAKFVERRDELFGEVKSRRELEQTYFKFMASEEKRGPGRPKGSGAAADGPVRKLSRADEAKAIWNRLLQEAAKRSVKDALPLLGEAETKVAYDALGDLRALLRRHLDEFGG